jgi:hypothetical protein
VQTSPPTEPEQAKEFAGEQTDSYNPLEVSPANPKVRETGRGDSEFPVEVKTDGNILPQQLL